MPRWRLVISGRVQTAGYRAMVKNIALGLQVKGIARNLDDGTVEIYCEASPENFKQFSEAIEVKADPQDHFMPNVTNVTVHDEKSPGYSEAPHEFKGFNIDYTGLDPQLETLERSEMAIIVLGAVRSEVKSSRQDIQAMHTDLKGGFKETKECLTEVKNEMKSGFNNVESAVSSMHTDMNTRFDTLDTKYGEIGNKMENIGHDISDMKLLTSEFREFKDLFAIYVKHQLQKGSE